MMRVALLALCVSCTTFDPIPRNTCGNGLLEQGEDCDSKDPRCVQCAMACGQAADCPTSDYTCGVDGFCHAPSGAFTQAIVAGLFEADQMQVSDIDQDGVGDVVGVSSSSIVLRHGAASGVLASTDSFVTPTKLGTTIFGHIDSDASLDLAFSARDGMVAYTSPYGSLSPVAAPQALFTQNGQSLDVRYTFHIAPQTLGAIFVANGVFAIGAIDFLHQSQGTFTVPCSTAISPSELDLSRVEIYQVNKPGALTIDVLVLVQTTTGRTCVSAFHQDNWLLALPTSFDITPPGLPALTQRAVLADLDTDTDRCPHLVTAENGAANARGFDGVMIGHCTFKSASAPTGDALPVNTQVGADATLVGHLSVDPVAYYNLQQVAADALVTSDGVYGFVPTYAAWGSMYASARKLAGVVSADLNNDGQVDGVLRAEGSDDLDLLYRGTALFGTPGFEAVRLDTAAEVSSITIGDYDGNGFPDVGYVEQLTDHKRLMVAFGTSDRPLAPQLVGEFPDVLSVSVLSFPDSIDSLSIADDLLVLQPPVPGALATIFHGSPQRALLPYVDPRGLGAPPTVVHAAAFGHFGDTSASLSALSATAPGSGAVQTWLVPGNGEGLQVTSKTGVTVQGFADCAGAPSASVCIDTATYLTWPVGTSNDVVLAIDRASHAAVFDPAGTGTITATAATALVQAIPGGTQVKSLAAANVADASAVQLVAAFAPQPGSNARGAVLVCDAPGGVPQQCTDVVPIIAAAAPETTECVDAAPGHAAYRDPTVTPLGTSDVIVLCHDDGSSIYRVAHDAGGFYADKLVHAQLPLTALVVGDVTGDGVDDLAARTGELGSQVLVVFRQYTSREQPEAP